MLKSGRPEAQTILKSVRHHVELPFHAKIHIIIQMYEKFFL